MKHQQNPKVTLNYLTNSNLKNLIKLNKKKYRNEEGQILVEGKRLLDQIHNNGIMINELFCLKDQMKEFEYLNSNKLTICQQWQLERLSETKNSQQVIGLIPVLKKPIQKRDFLLYLDNISDPGNLGTIFRTALGLGIDGVITSPECCELFNPKAVRSSMGAILTMPSEEHDKKWLFEQSASIMVSCLEDSYPLTSIKSIPSPGILVIGSEAHGIDPEIISKADLKLNIPMSKKMESLNAAVAAGILIFYLNSNGYSKR